MSDTLEKLKADIEAAVKSATDRLSDADKAALAESIQRGTQHAANGDLHLVKVEANTAALLLWTEGNERGKRARRDLVDAVSGALVKGLIAAL